MWVVILPLMRDCVATMLAGCRLLWNASLVMEVKLCSGWVEVFMRHGSPMPLVGEVSGLMERPLVRVNGDFLASGWCVLCVMVWLGRFW